MSTSFGVSFARHRLNPFHLGFSGVFMLFPCVPTLANVLPFGHGFFSGVLLAAFLSPLARSSSSELFSALGLGFHVVQRSRHRHQRIFRNILIKVVDSFNSFCSCQLVCRLQVQNKLLQKFVGRFRSGDKCRSSLDAV